MARFRKKPVVIEATQWHEGMEVEGVICNPMNQPNLKGHYYVETLEGWLHVSEGDWIITGVKGEKYPCKPDVFAQTYEAGDETTVNDPETLDPPGCFS